MRRRWLESLVIGAGLVLVGARAVWQLTADPRVKCPDGFVEDRARADRVLSRLAITPETRDLVRRTAPRRGRLCFGRVGVPMITTARVLLLSRPASEGETAARVAHLLTHLDGGFAPVDGFRQGVPCDSQVDGALRAEATAMDLELHLRARFGVHDPSLRIAFADAWTAAPPDARVELAHGWLVAHPHGGEGVDGLADAYGARCREVVR